MRFERVCSGVYGDSRGALHIHVPELLAKHDMPDTPATRTWLARRAVREMRVEGIECVIVARTNGMAGVGQ